MGSERLRNPPAVFLLAAALALPAAAQASVGVTEIASKDGDPVTVFYPSSAEEKALKRGPFTLNLAPQGAPVRGNGRLVVVSPGAGGSPWVHSDLARALVESGFVVAMPEHRGDNYKDLSAVGPESWKRRPAEVSRAIDAVGQDPRFAPLLALDKVGMFGMSAGGHTALSLAGGRWSPALFKVHCEAHIAEDFYSCVGMATRLNGDFLDGLKKTIAVTVIRWRFEDTTWYTHAEPRIAAIVAGVPYAADFDMDSLAARRCPRWTAGSRRSSASTCSPSPFPHSPSRLSCCVPLPIASPIFSRTTIALLHNTYDVYIITECVSPGNATENP